MGRPSSLRYLETLRQDAARILELAPSGWDRPVAGCPGWDVRDTVRHLGEVYRHKAASVRLGRRAADNEYVAAPGPGEDLAEWYSRSLLDLLSVLLAAPPDARAWTWWPAERTLGFWHRRMAQETLVHRVDVEQALGTASSIPADLALDGVDEVLAVFLPAFLPEAGDVPGLLPGSRARLDVRPANDTGLAWRVELEGSRVVVNRVAPDAPADAAVTGSPGAVLLWLWGRLGSRAVSVSGDKAQVEAVRAALVAATQ
ncbi:maleylpyruvate isomerase family mycothiol-dependent enzyme [Motilibacter aurantiacus]|uniref:maleylpyruvate isomerase family mycothiol-dependent enzyme n=1 Tax=Motilibacter aurantiacus TaxID=2714955 RepID=UPI00140CC43B|nr:maleylpyruvate isomerase family mycothiol-dependent enzyme [Motilibacter aurantiacus]NHC46909.1 maleylpyruvate isomerase family mycothiol-dependent enzyme [Motilibacter aurantiacus]